MRVLHFSFSGVSPHTTLKSPRGEQEHRSTAQQCMLCWAALRRARSPCALTLSPVVPGSPTERALQAAGVESWVVNTTSHSVFDRPACIFPQRTDGDAQSTARMTVVYLSPDAELPLEGVRADRRFRFSQSSAHTDLRSLCGAGLRRYSLRHRRAGRSRGHRWILAAPGAVACREAWRQRGRHRSREG